MPNDAAPINDERNAKSKNNPFPVINYSSVFWIKITKQIETFLNFELNRKRKLQKFIEHILGKRNRYELYE